MAYRKNNVPSDAQSIPAFLDAELSEIERSQNQAALGLNLIILHAEPKVPTDGRSVLLVEADGTDWDPGAGAGLYAYRAGAWIKVG